MKHHNGDIQCQYTFVSQSEYQYEQCGQYDTGSKKRLMRLGKEISP